MSLHRGCRYLSAPITANPSLQSVCALLNYIHWVFYIKEFVLLYLQIRGGGGGDKIVYILRLASTITPSSVFKYQCHSTILLEVCKIRSLSSK